MNNEKIKNTLENTDELFARLKEQLDSIEFSEIIDGISTDELKERGLTSNQPVLLNRAQHSRKLDIEHTTLQPGIEFKRVPKDTGLDSIDINELQALKPVENGCLIATKDLKGIATISVGKNTEIKETETKLEIFSTCRGWLVISGETLHIIPSDIDHKIKLNVSDDKMIVRMDCTPSYGKGNPLTTNAVRNELNKQGIVKGIDINAIEKTVSTVNQSLSPTNDVIVAKGIFPVHGTDGKIELHFNTDKKEYDFRILPDGRIDYKNMADILMAQEGQLLATLIPPTKGAAGSDVYNNLVKAEDGKPAKLVAGKGVKTSPDKKQFFASCNGCLLYNKPTIEVVDTYIVKGDVDYSTGNINFNGTVIISGNVPDGFEVKAEGDIIVLRNVEAARLEAGRDIFVKGGVQGKGKGFVSAGRDIFVEYVQNGHLEAQGIIEIGNFAINSYIATTNQLCLTKKRGTLIGGEAYALRGFDVKSLGSEQGVKTFVEAGTDYIAQKTITEFTEITKLMSANLKKIDDTLKTVSVAFKNNPALAVARKPLVVKALEKRNEIDMNLKLIDAKISQLKESSTCTDPCFVKVFETCHSDVTIKIKKYQTTIVKPRSNVKFYEDSEAGRIGCRFY
jgi:uncharacterized protein (DUF342 family)